jgi:hypothetical protein
VGLEICAANADDRSREPAAGLYQQGEDESALEHDCDCDCAIVSKRGHLEGLFPHGSKVPGVARCGSLQKLYGFLKAKIWVSHRGKLSQFSDGNLIWVPYSINALLPYFLSLSVPIFLGVRAKMGNQNNQEIGTY